MMLNLSVYGFVSKELPFPPHKCRFRYYDETINAKVDVCISLSEAMERGRKAAIPQVQFVVNVWTHTGARGLNANTKAYSEAKSRKTKYKCTNKNTKTSEGTQILMTCHFVSYVLFWSQCLCLLACVYQPHCVMLFVCVFGVFVCLYLNAPYQFLPFMKPPHG